jgi:mycothiol S-conjugate amidase
MSFTRQRVSALHEALVAAGLESPYAEWLENWPAEDTKSGRVTTRVRCEEYFEIRDDALRAHATQVDPDGRWFHVPIDVQQKVWPTEDYELVRSSVGRDLPEDDLFAGVR